MGPEMAKHNIPYVNLPAQGCDQIEDLKRIFEQVVLRGSFVGSHDDLAALEKRLAEYCCTEEAIALNSGTDALLLAMLVSGIGKGDEVITPPNSFVASTATIIQLGATPVFADVLADQNIDPEKIARAITPRTKAIMPVHLTGRICQMDEILEILRRHDAPATFFVLGNMVEERPELVDRELHQGHAVGGHTYDHPRMGELALKMLREALDAFISKDVTLAHGVLRKDDWLDALNDQIVRELLTHMLGRPEKIEPGIDLMFVARHLERVGGVSASRPAASAPRRQPHQGRLHMGESGRSHFYRRPNRVRRRAGPDDVCNG